MKTKKLLLASGIAVALAASHIGSAAIEIQEEQKWLKNQLPVNKSADRMVAYYVRYKEGQQTSLEASMLSNGMKIDHHLADYNTYAVSLPENNLRALDTFSQVAFYEPVPEHKPLAQVVPWNIDQFQARDVWDVDRDGQVDDGAPDGSGVKFCIIDTGFYAAHDDFQGITHTGLSQISGEAYTEDGNGHGTHVAGTANAMNNDIGVVGVMPGGADLHIIKIFNNAGVWVAGQSNLGAAATACKDAGANAISMSLGGGSSATEEAIFQDLYDNFNVINVAAAGNDGNNAASFPASYDSVISVAALNEDETWASFSQFPATSYDPNNQPANTEWDMVELSGGGAAVLSTWPGPPHGNVPVIQVTNDGTDYSGTQIAETGAGDVTQNLVDGGLCDTGDIDPAWNGNVVLCERGAIAFANKMNNVADTGGVAVVLFNNVAGALNATCGGNCTSGATIPGVAILQSEGQFLAANGLGLPTRVLVDDGSGCGGCTGGYNTISGTSMATPGVAAGIAWAWDACGGPSGITNKQLRQLLRDSAKDLDSASYDARTGFGLVQLKDALELGNQLYGSTCPIGLSATPSEIEVCTMNPAPNAEFTITLDDDFTGTSNMTSSGIPAGASGSFSVNPVVFPQTTTVLTVSSLDGIASGTHAISATATDNSDPLNNASANLSLVTVDAIPGTASLTIPADGATGVASQPTFTWSASTQAASYTFEIADDVGFSNILETASGITGNSHTLGILLNNEATYFWRVTATNICGDQVTASSTFTTGTEVCQLFNSADVPVIISASGTPTVSSTLSVQTNGTISDVDVVTTGDHTWINDLTFTIESPAATTVTLMDRICNSEDNWDVTFDDEAAAATLPCPPADGNSYQPTGNLSDFDGEDMLGTWTFGISDAVNLDGGQLNSWGLNICYVPTGGAAAAVNDNMSATEDGGGHNMDVMGNDVNAGSSTITAVTQGANGAVTIGVGSANVNYDPATDFCGNDSFTYTLDGTSTATVDVTVDCVNDQPDFTLNTLAQIGIENIATPPAQNVACSFDMGPADEDSSQAVADFVVTVDSDPNGILSSVDVANDGSLTATYSGALGTAVVNVSLQDDGGTANGGVDTSNTQQIQIEVEDMIFSSDFEIIVPPVTQPCQ